MKLNLVISLFFVFFVGIFRYSQTYNYTYTDPCTGNLKTIVVPINGEITVETDFSEMTFDGELNVGETLVLDSELLTAKVVETDGNVRSAIPYLDKLDFPVLQPGTNHISITTKGDASLDNYRVKSNSRWK